MPLSSYHAAWGRLWVLGKGGSWPGHPVASRPGPARPFRLSRGPPMPDLFLNRPAYLVRSLVRSVPENRGRYGGYGAYGKLQKGLCHKENPAFKGKSRFPRNFLDTEEVISSIHVPPTILSNGQAQSSRRSLRVRGVSARHRATAADHWNADQRLARQVVSHSDASRGIEWPAGRTQHVDRRLMAGRRRRRKQPHTAHLPLAKTAGRARWKARLRQNRVRARISVYRAGRRRGQFERSL
jgi:hypothetical protein